MQLADFIKRALGFFDRAETNLTAADELKKAQARVLELEGQLAGTAGLRDRAEKAEKAATEKDGEIANLKTEIAKLKADLVTEKNKANATIAGQGLELHALPAAEPAAGGPAGETAWAKYQRLLSEDPRKAGEFWAQSADQIIKSRIEG